MELYDQLVEITKTGEEVAIRAFLADHFAELPEPVQQKVAFLFLRDHLDGEAALSEVRAQAVAAAEAVLNTRGEADNTERIAELKKELGAS